MKKNLTVLISIAAIATVYAMSNNLTTQKGAPKEPEPLETQEKAVSLITNLIKMNSAFAVKLSSPLLSGKMRQWQQRGLVKVPTEVTWDMFKKDIHQFGTYLYAFLGRDPKTGAYYHIDPLRKDHAIYNSRFYEN